MRPRLIQSYSAFLFLTAMFMWSPGLGAYDQQISSHLWAEGYSVQAADGSTIRNRDIVEDLHLAAWNILPGSSDPYYMGPRLSVEIDLRLGGDYGVENWETDPTDIDKYVPGAQAMDAQAIFAYVDATGLLNGAVDIRAGRQIRLSSIGFFAFDGLEFTARMPHGISSSIFLGYEVKGGHPFGYDSLEVDGVDNGGRGDLDDAYFARLVEPIPRLSFGGELGWQPTRWLDGALAIRIVGLNGTIAQHTVAARIATFHERVRTSGLIVMNPMFDRRDDFGAALKQGTLVSRADGSLEVRVAEDGWLGVEYQLYRPIFMADSIFNVFGLIPRRDLGLRFTQGFRRSLSFACWSFLRFEDESGGITGESLDGAVSGVGGGAGANYNSLSRRLSLRMNAQREWGGTRIGLETGAWRGFVDDRLWLGLRASFWHVDDLELGGITGNIAGWVGSARFEFTEMARILGELENYFGGGRGPRVMALLALQLDLWK